MRNPVGLSKITGIKNKWNVCYSDGTYKSVSHLWNISPNKFRTWYLFRRHMKVMTFDQIVKERNHNEVL